MKLKEEIGDLTFCMFFEDCKLNPKNKLHLCITILLLSIKFCSVQVSFEVFHLLL